MDLLLYHLYENPDLSNFDKLLSVVPDLVGEYESRIIPVIKRHIEFGINTEVPNENSKSKEKKISVDARMNQVRKELYKTIKIYWEELTGYSGFNWMDKLRESLSGREKEAVRHFDDIVTILQRDELPRVFRVDYCNAKKVIVNPKNNSMRIE